MSFVPQDTLGSFHFGPEPATLESTEQESGLLDDFESELLQNSVVENAPLYQVAEAGVYWLLDLVPCKQPLDTIPSCAFLAATIIGLDPTKVKQNESS